MWVSNRGDNNTADRVKVQKRVHREATMLEDKTIKDEEKWNKNKASKK